MTKRKSKTKSAQPDKPTPPVIPEDEQWRIIEQTGILDGKNTTVRRRTPRLEVVDSEDERELDEPVSDDEADDPPEDDAPEYIFQAIMLIVPMTFLYAMMDLLCRYQYAQHPKFWEEVKRVSSAVPFLSIFIYYTNVHKATRLAQFLMFLGSTASGLRLIWVVNHSGFLQVVRQSPSLAVIWVYMIIQLNLLPAVTSLAVLTGLVKYLDLKIVN